MKAEKAEQRMKKEVKKANRLLRLNKKKRRNPIAVLDEFYSTYHLKDVREMFQPWLQAGLTSDGGLYQSGSERSDLLFFHQNLELLIEAVYVLKEQLRGDKQGMSKP